MFGVVYIWFFYDAVASGGGGGGGGCCEFSRTFVNASELVSAASALALLMLGANGSKVCTGEEDTTLAWLLVTSLAPAQRRQYRSATSGKMFVCLNHRCGLILVFKKMKLLPPIIIQSKP